MPTTRPLKILLVEDNEFDLELILRELKTSGLVHQARAVDTLEQFDFEFKEFQPDIILCDFSMPGFDAFAVLSRVTASGLDIPVIIITGTLSDETAVECLKRGAADYLLKDKIIRLRSSIERALELRDSKTERQRILSRLSENEEQLRTITNVLPALLLYITPTLQIQFTNRTSELWLDSEQSAFIGNSVAKMLGDEFARRFVDEMPLLMQGVPVSFETFLPTVSGSKFVNTTITPDPGKSRGIKGFVCLITDISERKRYEQELLAARSAADSANKSKSLFLANMSHEMRTPLSAMMGFAELLLSKNESASDRTLWAEKIHKNCERLKNMIDEILDLSKIEAGKTQIEKSIFPVADVIAQVQSLLGPIAKEKGIQLVFSVQGKIPERICSDQTKLRHVLTNIIGNAIKFSSAGPVVVVLSLKDRNRLSTIVRDRGRGIAAEDAGKLFQPFTQADSSTTRQFGGTGLGLAIARRFSQALGGDVQLIASEVGEGSSFEITIDTGDISREAMIHDLPTVFQRHPKQAVPEIDVDLSGIKILLVEDSEENQFIVKRFLEKAGAHVDTAANGVEGIEKAEADHYDLVLMDIQMPVLDGYGATTRLRQNGYAAPITALTAHALKEERDRCFRMGFTGFLTKPINKNAILQEAAKYIPHPAT